MLLSIVTGTYNRLPHLQKMVDSARACLPRGIIYEFVIVDCGSTDGTLDWCAEQPDMHLLPQGVLRGAIPAFCDGAKAARGQYVLLANDDIGFEPNSILPAIVHLETHPQDGAVAFLDDRPAPGYGAGFKVQTIEIQVNGKRESRPYAQVGLFRKWLGDKCGWWGADDPAFVGKHTYGGDNYISARIYEYGYTIGVLPECAIRDYIPADKLREYVQAEEKKNPGAYYKRYPTPPVFGSIRKPKNPQAEQLRTLYLPIFEPGHRQQQHNKHGLRDALARVGLVYEIDYKNTRYDLAKAVATFHPHLLLMQVQGATDIPVQQLARARAEFPDMVVVNWNGDVYERGLTSPEMLAYLRHVDLQLTVNASVLEVYRSEGIPAAYWQVSFEPVNEDDLPSVPEHDVVFLANAYTDQRRQLGRMLQSMPGVNVGLYGRGWQWGNGDTTYDFATGTALYQHAKIAIGDNQYGDQRGFVSNRFFESLARGAFLLHQAVPGLEALTGLRDGVHYVAWSDADELQRKIRYWLAPRREDQRRAIAAAGRAFVWAQHSFDVRVRQLFDDLLPMIESVHDPA